MKRLILVVGYLLSLYLFWPGVQHRLFRWVLASGQPFEQAKGLYRFIVRLGKHRQFIEHVTLAPTLTENEKRVLKAQVWRHLRQYQKAWAELASVPPGDRETDELRVRTLYDLRQVDELLKLSKEISIGAYLTNEQQRNLVLFAFRHHGPFEARRLAELFADGEVESFFSQAVGKYRHLEESAHSWPRFAEQYGQRFDLSQEEQIEACLTWLGQLPPEEGELGLVLLMRHAAQDQKLYGQLIKRLFADKHPVGQESNLGLEKSAWSALGLAQEALEEGRYQLALHFALTAYREGDRSPLLRDLLLRSLGQAKLKRHDLLDLERLVDEGFIDLLDEKVLQLLSTSQGLSHLYATLDPARLNRDNLFRLAQAAQGMPKEEAALFWEVIGERLLKRVQPLDLDEKALDQLFQEASPNPSLVAYLKLRLAQEQGETPEGKREATDRVLSRLNREERVKALLFLSQYHSDRLQFKTALVWAEEAHQLAPRNIRVLRRLIGLNHRLGNINERLSYLESFRALSGTLLGREYDIALDEARLLKTKWEWNPSVDPLPLEGRSNAILHVLNKSLPAVNGYTVRSTEIITHQKARGLEPVVVTKLGWPPATEAKAVETEVEIGGVTHYRLYAEKGLELNKVPMSEYFQAYADQLAQLILKVKPRVIHAASNFQNALPALAVARHMKIPSVYEVRGMWQDTQSSKTPGFYLSERYLLHQDYEVYCCQLADRVVAISESLRQHLIHLGVDEAKIEVVPNGVDVERFVPREKDQELMERYQLEGKPVTGFIGSVTEYEGLDILLRALYRLNKQGTELKCLIVGDGPALNDLKRLAKELDLTEQVVFVGRVPHEEVARYYSVIDLFPFPRTKAKVCELVTPLKPYEAMAMGKLVLVSDIPALREMVLDGKTGLIFEAENDEALAEALLASFSQLELGQQSRLWVEAHRAWQKLVEAYPAIYEAAQKAQALEAASVSK